jgi:hypothetical protein
VNVLGAYAFDLIDKAAMVVYHDNEFEREFLDDNSMALFIYHYLRERH